MSSLTILGDTSGSVVLAAPAVAGSGTITLPTTGGTVITTASSGTILQVVNATTSTQASSNGTETLVISASIIPKFTNSKILITFGSVWVGNTTGGQDIHLRLKRGSTILYFGSATNYTYYCYSGSGQVQIPFTGTYLDTPATTSSTTYNYFVFGSGQVYAAGGIITLMEIAA
jgi:hypothetical protein